MNNYLDHHDEYHGMDANDYAFEKALNQLEN